MAGSLVYSALGNGGVGTTNVPDTVYEPAMVWFAVDAVSTFVFVALLTDCVTYPTDAIFARAGVTENMINKNTIFRIHIPPR